MKARGEAPLISASVQVWDRRVEEEPVRSAERKQFSTLVMKPDDHYRASSSLPSYPHCALNANTHQSSN